MRHPPVREGTVIHPGWMTQYVSLKWEQVHLHSMYVNMATSVRNVAAGIQPPDAQSKSEHGNKDQERGTDSAYY